MEVTTEPEDEASFDVCCLREVVDWLVSMDVSSYKKNKKSITGNISEDMIRLFGKYKIFQGSEYKLKVWILKYKELVFKVYTGPKFGASYECFLPMRLRNKKNANKIIDFLKELHDMINNNCPKWDE